MPIESLTPHGGPASRSLLSWLQAPKARRAILTVMAATLFTVVLVPALLPSRISFFGIPPARSIFAGLSTSKEHKLRLKRKALEKWMESERVYAWKKLLGNINPPGTDPGCVVASPSHKDPDYWYQWTRDSAMVFKVIIEYSRKDSHHENAEKLVFDYIKETKKMQRMETPSGGFRTGGLGEVKFNGDGTPFTGSWGRPQNDGPALRASALMEFANTLLDRDPAKYESYVRKELYDSSAFNQSESAIKADLDFVCGAWSEPCFDLWEEVNGLHHFNMLITIRGLYDGYKFATRLGDTAGAAKYKKTAEEIQAKGLEKFWDEDKKYLKATVEFKNAHGKVGWLDTGTVLGFLHSGNLNRLIGEISPSNAQNLEYLGSDKSLMTQHAIALSMRDEYSINRRYYSPTSSNSQQPLGYGIGRYYEDVYDGSGVRRTGHGNPWYLCTLAHAEFYYRLIHYFRSVPISINELNKPFFLELGYFKPGTEDEELMAGQTYKPASKEHSDLLEAFKEKGDAFVSVVKDWAKWNGGLWEQFDRETGVEMGAPDLTWSYASFLSCMEARNAQPMFD